MRFRSRIFDSATRDDAQIRITYRPIVMFAIRNRLSSLTCHQLRCDSGDFSENTAFSELREACASGTLTREAFLTFTRDKPVEHRFQITPTGSLEWTQIVHDLYPSRQGTLNLPSHTIRILDLTADKLKTDIALHPARFIRSSLKIILNRHPKPCLQLIFNIIVHLPRLPMATVVSYRIGHDRFASKISAWTNFWITELPPKMSVYHSEEVLRVDLEIPKIERLHQLVSRLLFAEFAGILQSMNMEIWTDRDKLANNLLITMGACGIASVPLYGYHFCLLDGKLIYHNIIDVIDFGVSLV